MRNRNYIFILFLILFISVGFAILTVNLGIDGNVSFIDGNFDVHFEDAVIEYDNSLDGTVSIDEDNRDTVTSSLSLEKPGDYAEYSVRIVNAGTMDASLDTLSVTGLTDAQKKYFTTSVTYAYDGSNILKNDYLRAGQSKKIKFRITYNFDVLELSSDTKLNVNLKIDYINPKKLSKDTVFDYEYSGTEQIFYVQKSGKYRLEVWGAQGGGYGEYYGGYGAYAVGEVTLSRNEKLYVNVGGAELDGYIQETIYPGGYNGGGNAHRAPKEFRGIGTGGGATHIALSSGLLKDLESKKSDILIVAAGGGAGANPYFEESNYYYANGGHGGGITGGSSTGYSGFLSPDRWSPCQGGGQVVASSRPGGEGTHPAALGSFGQGGFYILSDSTNYSSSGGGAGYYGGDGCRNFGGGGGSSYIGNKLLLDKAMYCFSCIESESEDTKTISVDAVSDKAISKSAKMGNGHVRITFIG